MKSIISSITITFSLLFLVSCSSINTVMNAPKNSGVSRFFTEDHELVKSATLASMKNLNINIKETDQTPDGFIITFTKSTSAFSWGEVGRVLIVKNHDSSQVFVHSQKRSKYQITGTSEQDFANNIFRGISQVLKKNKE